MCVGLCFQSSPALSEGALDVDEGDDEAAVETEEGVSVEEDVTSTPKSTKLPLKPRTKTAKKKREEEETLLIQGLTKSLAVITERKKPKQTDDCEAYGSYVVECLGKLDPRTRCIVQHQMNTIMFNAQLGILHQPHQPNVYPVPQTQFPSPIPRTQSSPSPSQQVYSPQHVNSSPVFNF